MILVVHFKNKVYNIKRKDDQGKSRKFLEDKIKSNTSIKGNLETYINILNKLRTDYYNRKNQRKINNLKVN